MSVVRTVSPERIAAHPQVPSAAAETRSTSALRTPSRMRTVTAAAPLAAAHTDTAITGLLGELFTRLKDVEERNTRLTEQLAGTSGKFTTLATAAEAAIRAETEAKLAEKDRTIAALAAKVEALETKLNAFIASAEPTLADQKFLRQQFNQKWTQYKW